MKLVSFKNINGEERTGVFVNEQTIDLVAAAKQLSLTLPTDMNKFLEGGEKFMDMARKVERASIQGNLDTSVAIKPALLSPVPHPPSCRDGYAFRQHVATARRNRGAEMIVEFDQYPIFYFTNHNAIFGEGDIVVESDHLKQLDFELEAAIVIGKRGKNISSNEADEYVAGYTIMNDFSARVLQLEEM